MIHLSGKSRSVRVFLGSLGSWWKRWGHMVFFVLFVIVAGLGVFSWYRSLYLFHWNADEETKYRRSKDTQVKFQQEKFEKALKMLEERRTMHQAISRDSRDIFFDAKK